MTNIIRTPLHRVSTFWDRIEMCKFLIKIGVDVNLQDEFGNTALIEAVKDNISTIVKKYNKKCALLTKSTNYDLVELLIKMGANVTVQNNEKNTALHYTRMEDIAELLLKNGAHTNIINSKGDTPKDTSIKYKIHKVTLLIVEYENKQKIERNEQIDCIICFEPKNGTFAFLPCGHAKTCENCCKNIMQPTNINPECPTCRQPVTIYQKIFI